jgi:hypothetical protein
MERMKFVIAASIAFLYPCHTWDKPLNPILGETFQGTLLDGTDVYLEQISHHPPISFILLEGPDKLYRFSGYSNFSVKASINSINLEVQGCRTISFPDGTVIKYNNQNDTFGNSLIGTLHH